MPVNPYFQNFYNQPEQNLMDDLAVEFVKMYGLDFTYIPRTIDHFDELHKEAELVSYNSNYLIEMYIKNYHDHEGEQKFMGFAGMIIDDGMKLSVAVTSFKKEVGDHTGFIRPREGDLLWFPLAKRLFTITFVKQEEAFFQFGKNFFWELTAVLYVSNSEVFRTGIADIDDVYNGLSASKEEHQLEDTDNDLLLDTDGYPMLGPENNIEDIAKQSQNNIIDDKFQEINDGSEDNLGGWR